MTRRKGERPLERRLDRWSSEHPAARMIASGDSWFNAWVAQKATPLRRLSRQTGIGVGRLMTIGQGGHVSRAEIDALARAWTISAADLIASMPDPTIVVD